MRCLALVCLALALVTFGFGCKEPDYERPATTNWRGVIQGPSKKNPQPVKPASKPTSESRSYDDERPVSPEVVRLRQTLRNLTSAKTFRATLTLPPADGQTQPIQGEMVFDRERGLRGQLSIQPKIKSEIFVIHNSGQVYFRANTSSWENISHTNEADRLQQFFRVVFPEQVKNNQVLISDSAKILEVSDDPSGCRRYVFDEVMPSSEREQTTICVKDNLPVYIINQYAEGATEVRYSNINQPVELGGLN